MHCLLGMAVDTRLYDILGVPPTASTAEIKKAFRKLALKHHPDKGGEVDQFQEMVAAHEVLADEEKRRLYDAHGEEGLRQTLHESQESGSNGADAATDLFSALFGSNNPFGSAGLFGSGGGGLFRAARSTRKKVASFTMRVTLEEAFAGSVRKVKVRRHTACDVCDGVGLSDPSAVARCSQCDGSGIRLLERRAGFMVQRMEVTCQACRGTGRTIPPEAVCRSCTGQGVQQTSSTVEVRIPAGVADGHTLVLQGQGDQLPGREADDLLCRVEVADHPIFARHDAHLVLPAEVSLEEALTGCRLTRTHLDGRQLRLRSPRGDLWRPGSLWRLRGEGMPVLGRPGVRGDLLVRFAVRFPDRLEPEMVSRLRAAVAPPPVDPAPAAAAQPREQASAVAHQSRPVYLRMWKSIRAALGFNPSQRPVVLPPPPPAEAAEPPEEDDTLELERVEDEGDASFGWVPRSRL